MSLPEPAEETNPFAPPRSDVTRNAPPRTPSRLARLAESQRRTLFAFGSMFLPVLVGGTALGALGFVDTPAARNAALVIGVMSGLAILTGYLLHVVETFTWIHTFLGVRGALGFVLLIWASLLVAVVLYVVTTRELKAAGYRVGVFGVPAREFEAVSADVTP